MPSGSFGQRVALWTTAAESSALGGSNAEQAAIAAQAEADRARVASLWGVASACGYEHGVMGPLRDIEDCITEIADQRLRAAEVAAGAKSGDAAYIASAQDLRDTYAMNKLNMHLQRFLREAKRVRRALLLQRSSDPGGMDERPAVRRSTRATTFSHRE